VQSESRSISLAPYVKCRQDQSTTKHLFAPDGMDVGRNVSVPDLELIPRPTGGVPPDGLADHNGNRLGFRLVGDLVYQRREFLGCLHS